MAQSIGVLNNIRTNASEEYKNRIPEATQENISAIGNALQTYTTLQNEFCSALVNKIGKTIIESKLFKNKLARFKSGALLTQQDVEEIFIEMAKAEGSYDPEGKTALARRTPPDVKTIYHRMNRQDRYVVSIGDIDFVRVFRSADTLDTFISGLINSVYSGAAYDEWLAMKELLATYSVGDESAQVIGYATVTVPHVDPENDDATISDEEFAKEFVKSVRKVVADLSFPSRKYNAAGVMTWTDPENLVLLVNKDVLAEVDVEVLAKAFNMGKTDFEPEVISMDDFGSNGTMMVPYPPIAILMDKDFFRIWDTLSHMEPQRNAEGLFTNYFYHVHQILSLSTFKNAVVFLDGLDSSFLG